MQETFICMVKDIQEVLVYYPAAVLIGFLSTMIFVYVHKKQHWKLGRARTVVTFLFLTYVVMLLSITYFSREAGSRIGVDFRLFGTWGEWSQAKAYFLENILLFIPFGCFLPIVWKRTKNILLMFFVSGLLSCSIESAQYFTKRGYCQLDDVVTNISGALIGWFIYMMFALTRWLCRKVKKRKRID